MDLFIQRLVDGVGDGVLYGFVALALVLIFRATNVLNFAQGEMAMLCTFVIWKLADPGLGVGIPLILAIAGGVLFGFGLGALLERVVMRPFEGGDHLRQAMVTMGLFLGINALAGWVFTLEPQRLASPFPEGRFEIGGVLIPHRLIGLICVVVVLAIALRYLFMHTRVGLAMRAASANPISARLHGVNVENTLMFGWALSGALGALAGALLAPQLFVSVGMMQNVLLYGFAAAAIGGFDSAAGALVGGVIVGLIQHLAAGYVEFIGNELQLATALALILVVLLVRPQGLFGSARVERV